MSLERRRTTNTGVITKIELAPELEELGDKDPTTTATLRVRQQINGIRTMRDIALGLTPEDLSFGVGDRARIRFHYDDLGAGSILRTQTLERI